MAHRIVIIGGGFGGLCAARGLGRAGAEVTLVDRRNHHLFQPLLYQVATGGLSPANIAAPIRALVKRQANTRVLLDEVTKIDCAARRVDLAVGEPLAYDSLIVAAGAGQSYFGNDEWQRFAPGLKSLEDATAIRGRVLMAFERAEREPNAENRQALLTFVVVGGGPTGVELAGALAEVSRSTLSGQFRQIDPASARVILLEGAERILLGFSAPLAARATRSLERLGVEVRVGCRVEHVSRDLVELSAAGVGEQLDCGLVLWAAGVKASPLASDLLAGSSTKAGPGGRVPVEPDCSLPGCPEVFVIGDMASFAHQGEQPLPGLAPVAMQQGRYVARLLRRRLDGRSSKPFRYLDKGNMATVGRKMAIAEIGNFKLSGPIAWLAWLFIHLMYLAEFENRLLVFVQWGWGYFSRNRSARLITSSIGADSGPQPQPGDTETESVAPESRRTK